MSISGGVLASSAPDVLLPVVSLAVERLHAVGRADAYLASVKEEATFALGELPKEITDEGLLEEGEMVCNRLDDGAESLDQVFIEVFDDVVGD